MPKKQKITVPDYITFIRFIAIPIIFILIIKGYFISAFVLYAIAASTDAIDGIAAKLLKQKTKLGGMLDALADRCLMVFIILALLIKGNIIPLWALIIMICYGLMDLGLGMWITKKYKIFYLYLAHRDSIRNFAILFFIALAGYVLAMDITIFFANMLLAVTILYAFYAYADYVRYTATHKKW